MLGSTRLDATNDFDRHPHGFHAVDRKTNDFDCAANKHRAAVHQVQKLTERPLTLVQHQSLRLFLADRDDDQPTTGLQHAPPLAPLLLLSQQSSSLV
jgi:hypothetical protein